MSKKYLWAVGIAFGLIFAIIFWLRPGLFKVFLAYSALLVLGLAVVMLVVSGIAWIQNRRMSWLASLISIAKTWRIPVGLIIGIVVACLAFAVFVVNQASQPVVSCANAPKKPVSTPPAAFATAQDFIAQGDYDYEQGNCDKAIADYTHVIELNPNLAEAYNNRAYVYMVKKDYALALPDLDRAIQLRPDYVNALMNRGDIYNYYYSIDYARAVLDYDRVLKIDPNAANHTSVCGHRMLALQHGWNLGVLGELITTGPMAGCPTSMQ